MFVSTACRTVAPARHALSRAPSRVMFSALKQRIWGSAGDKFNACANCDPEVLAKCQKPEPGSVTPHVAHVLVRLPPTVPDAAEDAQQDGAWWPNSVDSEPAIEAVNSALKQCQAALPGKVKVTAWDEVAGQGDGAAAPGTFDVLIFPAGIKLSGLELGRVGGAVARVLVQDPSQLARVDTAEQEEALVGLTLLVCCHGKRDSRCGVLGSQLARKLVELVQDRGLGAQVRVLKTSHVGGHVYAGNVLVYGAGSACNGDWFGGVNADNAEMFLGAVLEAKVPGSADPQLRELWRGRGGLGKDEQKALFEQHAGGVRDIEDLRRI